MYLVKFDAGNFSLKALLFVFLFSLPFFYSTTGYGIFDLSDVKKFPVQTEVIFVGLIGFLFIRDLYRRELFVSLRFKFPIAAFLFFLANFIFVLTSLFGFSSQQVNFSIYMLLLLLCFFYFSGKVELVDSFIDCLIFSGLLHAVFGLYMMVHGGVFLFFDYASQYPNYFRLHGLMANPNYAANVLGLSFLLSIYKYGLQRRVLVTLFLLLCFLLTFSRGAMIALLGGVFISCVVLGGIKVFFKILLVSLVVFFVFLFFVDLDFLFLALRAEDLDNVSTFSGRADIWAIAIDEIYSAGLVDLLIGHGYGAFSDVIGYGAHSFYLKTLFENGLIFLSCFIFFLVVVLLSIMKEASRVFYKRESIICLSILLFFVFRGLTSPNLFNSSYSGVVFIFFVIVLLRRGAFFLGGVK